MKKKRILFIQPYDRPGMNPEYVENRRYLQIPRAMLEVGYFIHPEKYDIFFLDVNLKAKQQPGLSVKEMVNGEMSEFEPDLVLVAFPTYAQGAQVREIVFAVKEIKPEAKIILGGATLNLIEDAPLKSWHWPIDACYWGNGWQLSELIQAVLEAENSRFLFRSDLKGKLLDGYESKEFYSVKGRFGFEGYLMEAREANLIPTAFVEMTRGCNSFCSYCAFGISGSACSHRKPETVLDEIRYLAGKGIIYVYIIDPTFGMAKKMTVELLEGLSIFHVANPEVKFDVITRPEYVTKDFAEELKAAGIVRCGIGMETMDREILKNYSKAITPEDVRTAVKFLAEAGIEVRLFHLIFPGKISVKTLEFLLELSREEVSFVIQSSFLRSLPTSESRAEFWTQDRTVFNPAQDTFEQLMEYLLINLAFPSMDLDFEDSEIRNLIKKNLEKGRRLKTLFSQSRENGKIVLKIGSYTFTSNGCDPVSVCITKK